MSSAYSIVVKSESTRARFARGAKFSKPKPAGLLVGSIAGDHEYLRLALACTDTLEEVQYVLAA